MDLMYWGFILFLFLLAIFDLWVGVSNDAVNFLNSAIGSKAARFRTIILIASLGVFFGATMSNGMMDIARHGIFKPEQFSFEQIMYICLAVMAADIILLDIFNTYGMPTSTTVSMVFELLGASFAFSMIQLAGSDNGMALSDYMNTSKALSVIMAIFVSVAIAFFFGFLIQYIARLVFTFRYKEKLRGKIGLFGGIAATAIIYFMLIKGVKDLSFMTPDVKNWIHENSGLIVIGCLVFFTLLMQILHMLRVNVLKVVVLMGTFALATAFAGNDLVNFIGVPLTGYSAFQDYAASGSSDPAGYMMGALNAPATTPVVFLIGAGAIMVIALMLSKKAHNVTKTEINLARQDAGEEMFGSSKAARSLVRWGNSVATSIINITPESARRWIKARFDATEIEAEDGAAYDLVRASVNLVIASLLIALGTSLKLPLSTTYVTFMVAMGSSLADKAWGRESAVFRITGVLSVIGGWFITAGAAFTSCFLMALLMYAGGNIAAIIIVAFSIFFLIRSHIKYNKKTTEEKETDKLFKEMLASKQPTEVWPLLTKHVMLNELDFLKSYADMYKDTTEGFITENLKLLWKSKQFIGKEKYRLKNLRRKETLCLRMSGKDMFMKKGTWFHSLHNGMEQIYYSVRRMYEPIVEHLENNFPALPDNKITEFETARNEVINFIEQVFISLRDRQCIDDKTLIARGAELQKKFSTMRKQLALDMQEDNINLTVAYLYLIILQESEQFVVQLQQLTRASEKFYTAQ